MRAAIDSYRPIYEEIPAAEAPEILARHVHSVVEQRLAHLKNEAERLEVANQILRTYGTEDDVLIALEQLIEIQRLDGLNRPPRPRPLTSLSALKLLTNSPAELRIGQELSRELESADSVDLICAFIRFAGIRPIKEQLVRLATRGVRLRVLTTVYTGSTERKALDMLVRDCGAQVKVSYDVSATRLHAKAWLIKRNSGYDTGFIGSSNLTHTALHDGIEWNIRVSKVAAPTVVNKFEATFATYWDSQDFEDYDPDRDAERFDAATARADGGAAAVTLASIDVRPYPHQVAALEAIQTHRLVHDRHRNLVVAATGTGKTILAALDYRRLCGDQAQRPSLLFVAHRIEILEQARLTYRHVLGDGSFGEVFSGGARPVYWDHVFASVQSLSQLDLAATPPSQFDVIVVDEFHHAAAKTYRRLLDHFTPVELLGLTATPERTDGFDVTEYFGNRTAFELRLWDALDDGLLSPFHYYGIADGTDLAQMEWKRDGYVQSELDNLYTGNDARARIVLAAVEDHIVDPHRMRALGFCVSVAHARYMARVFNDAGISAEVVTGELSQAARSDALRRWRTGDIAIVFAVDVFNEGVDVPELDTILMLRPTESSVIFQQQLGRGLRKSPRKALLTVLDFIGHHRHEFRFAERYRALTGAVGRELERQVSDDFPYLPSGSRIMLDRVSKDEVLANIRTKLRSRRQDLRDELRSLGDVSLAQFLAKTGRSLSEIYRQRGWSWLDLRSAAGFAAELSESEQTMSGQLRRMLHVDDVARLKAFRALVANSPAEVRLDAYHHRLALMLLALVYPDWERLSTVDEGLAQLHAAPRVVDELIELCDLLTADIHLVSQPLPGLPDIPLHSHATYSREEILIAFDQYGLGKRNNHREGVQWIPRHQVDALFVTLDKDERSFTPQVRYKDYPISLTRFHWESQNAIDPSSPTGRRYIGHQDSGSRVVLFTRHRSKQDNGLGTPFLCLGTARYVEHRGTRPMAIVWELDRPMPGEFFAESAIAR